MLLNILPHQLHLKEIFADLFYFSLAKTISSYECLYIMFWKNIEKKVDLRCILVGAGDTVAPFPVQLTER